MELFAYSSKGLPGIEILGVGKQGRLIKEKIMFYIKSWDLKIAAKKYVICLESSEIDLSQEYIWLELPALLLLLSLSSTLPLKNLEKVVTAGKIALNGNIVFPPTFNENINILFQEDSSFKDCTVISEAPISQFLLKNILIAELFSDWLSKKSTRDRMMFAKSDTMGKFV